MANPYDSAWPKQFEDWAKDKIEKARYRLQQEVALTAEDKAALEADVSFLWGAIERINAAKP